MFIWDHFALHKLYLWNISIDFSKRIINFDFNLIIKFYDNYDFHLTRSTFTINEYSTGYCYAAYVLTKSLKAIFAILFLSFSLVGASVWQKNVKKDLCSDDGYSPAEKKENTFSRIVDKLNWWCCQTWYIIMSRMPHIFCKKPPMNSFFIT